MNPFKYRSIPIVFIVILALLGVYISNAQETKWTVEDLKASSTTNKLIVVVGQADKIKAKVYAFEKQGNTWEQKFMFPGCVGYNGISSEKKEGDGKTPAGVYDLGRAFGVAPDPGSSTPYTQLTDTDCWVDDPKSKYYNTWAKSDSEDKDWDSAEDLSYWEMAYKYSMVIEYNTTNIVKGAGSAIMLHCSADPATAGCVSVPTQAMVDLLSFIEEDTKIVIAESEEALLRY